jgi:CO/xanthine dehydrogenase FAD-binding subunit
MKQKTACKGGLFVCPAFMPFLCSFLVAFHVDCLPDDLIDERLRFGRRFSEGKAPEEGFLRRREEFFAVGVYTSTILDEDELVKEVFVPAPAAGSGSAYLKYRQRQAIDFPLFGAAVNVTQKDGVVEDARIVIGAAAPVPIRAKAAEAFLTGKELTEETAAAAAEEAIWRASFRRTSLSAPVRSTVTAATCASSGSSVKTAGWPVPLPKGCAR